MPAAALIPGTNDVFLYIGRNSPRPRAEKEWLAGTTVWVGIGQALGCSLPGYLCNPSFLSQLVSRFGS
jgi:hypothetical protein